MTPLLIVPFAVLAVLLNGASASSERAMSNLMAHAFTSTPDHETLHRFEDEGLAYVTQVRLSNGTSHDVHRAQDIAEAISAAIASRFASRKSAPPSPSGAIRVTSEGHVYQSTGLLVSSDLETVPTPPKYRSQHRSQAQETVPKTDPKAAPKSGLGRGLRAIFGRDTRVDCPAYTKGLPYSSIGEADVKGPSGR